MAGSRLQQQGNEVTCQTQQRRQGVYHQRLACRYGDCLRQDRSESRGRACRCFWWIPACQALAGARASKSASTCDTAELFFSDLIVPEEALLGEEGKGFAHLMQELREWLVWVPRQSCIRRRTGADDGLRAAAPRLRPALPISRTPGSSWRRPPVLIWPVLT